MKIVKSIITLLLFSLISFAQTEDECYKCHISAVGDKPAQAYSSDVHFSLRISCAECHGGDSSSDDMEKAMDKKKGFIAKPGKNQIVDICLKCHASEETMRRNNSKINVKEFLLFKSAVHGKPEIVTCVTCHNIHNIKRVNDPTSPVYPSNETKLCASCHSDANYMKQFNPSLPTDQLEKYKTSTHGKKLIKGDVKVATCTDCHNSHAIFPAKEPRSSVYSANIPSTCAKCHSNKEYMKKYNIPTDQFEKFSLSVHGVALLKKNDRSAPACNDCHGNHGAVPLGLESISHVCGTCHALNDEMFSRSPHSKIFKQKNIPQCEICHSNHLILQPTDEMLGIDENSVCIKCHKSSDKGYILAKQMKAQIDTLSMKNETAKRVLENAENKGMDISSAKFDLNEIPQILIKARTITHTVNKKEFDETINPGFELVDRIIKEGNDAIVDFYFRRWGLLIATLIITFLAIALYLKIRSIEKKNNH